MSAPSQMRVFADAVPQDGGAYAVGYTASTSRGQLVGLGVDCVNGMPNRTYANRMAVRYAMTDLLKQFDLTEVSIAAPNVDHPQLELGRLPPEQRRDVQDVEVELRMSGESYEQQITSGLLRQFPDDTWVTQPTVSSIAEPIDLFTDASHNPKTKQATGGYVAIDDEGRILTAKGLGIGDHPDSLNAEAEAVRQGLKAVHEIAPRHEKQLRSDCKPLVKALNGGPITEALQPRVNDAQTHLRTAEHSEASAIPREQNKLADALADIAYEGVVELAVTVTADYAEPTMQSETKYSP